MKNLLLLIFLLVLLISCAEDSDSSLSKSKGTKINKYIGIVLNPENRLNSYDFKGKRYYDDLSLYRKQNKYPNSFADLNDQIIFMASQIQEESELSKNIIPFTDETIHDIMLNPENNMITIIKNCTLSNSAKKCLINFLQGLIIQRQMEFSINYNYIVEYENTIISKSSLSEADIKIILTVTSISRYSLYSELLVKDRDWDKSSGNKTGRSIFKENDISIISIIALLDVIN